MRRLVELSILMLLIIGCSGIQPMVRLRPGTKGFSELSTDDQCLALLERRDDAGLVGKILTGVGGVGALGAAPDSLPSAARWGIAAGASSLVAAGLAVIWYAEKKGDVFERYCETNEKEK